MLKFCSEIWNHEYRAVHLWVSPSNQYHCNNINYCWFSIPRKFSYIIIRHIYYNCIFCSTFADLWIMHVDMNLIWDAWEISLIWYLHFQFSLSLSHYKITHAHHIDMFTLFSSFSLSLFFSSTKLGLQHCWHIVFCHWHTLHDVVKWTYVSRVYQTYLQSTMQCIW